MCDRRGRKALPELRGKCVRWGERGREGGARDLNRVKIPDNVIKCTEIEWQEEEGGTAKLIEA